MATDFRSGHDYPRRAREVYGGYNYLLRVFDKGRAAKHGTIHDFIYPCPIDRAVFGIWGITAADFDGALETCTTDEAILAWMDANVPAPARERANHYLLVERRHNLDKHDIEEGVAPDLGTLAGRIALARTQHDVLDHPQKEILEDFHEVLVASGQRERALGAGDRAPELGLQGPLVVCFVRGTWSLECVIELAALDEIVPELRAAGVNLVAFSPERPERIAAFLSRKPHGFAIRSDRGCALAERFGIAYRVPDEVQTVYRDGLSAELALVNDDPDRRLPMPARFVIDAAGIIRHAQIFPIPVQRAEPRETLAAVAKYR